jgi:hypothetical protein
MSLREIGAGNLISGAGNRADNSRELFVSIKHPFAARFH